MIWKSLLCLLLFFVQVGVEGRKKKGDTIILHHGKKCIPTIIKQGGRVKGDFILVPTSQDEQKCHQDESKDEKKAESSLVPKFSMPSQKISFYPYPKYTPVYVPVVQRKIIHHYIYLRPTYKAIYQPTSSYISTNHFPISGRDYFGPGQYQQRSDPTLYSYSTALNRQKY